MSKNTFKRHVELLLIEEEGKDYYVLIKDFSPFTFYHTLNSGRIHFCRYYLQDVSTTKILKSHVNDYFKING